MKGTRSPKSTALWSKTRSMGNSLPMAIMSLPFSSCLTTGFLMIEPIQHTKTSYLGGSNPRLHTDEVLVALSVLSDTDEDCRHALEQLPKLRGCQVHCTVILGEVDRKIFKKLGINLTCEPVLKK